MRRELRCLSLVVAALCPLVVEAQSAAPRYWSDTWRGWHFYED
jgi:conjugal transfer pilus assembly protein TraF